MQGHAGGRQEVCGSSHACTRGTTLAPSPLALATRFIVHPTERRAPPLVGWPIVRLRIDLAYDGAGFHGWATQPGLRTVQGELEAALATVLRVPRSAVVCAGRTDTGVHARGQVVHLDVERETLAAAGRALRSSPRSTPCCRRLNGVLPADVRVRRVAEAPGRASTPGSRRCGAATPTGSPTTRAGRPARPRGTCSPGRGRSTSTR